MSSNLKSKLSTTKYPCLTYDEALKYVTFASGVDLTFADPVVLGRIAALCKYVGKKGTIVSFYRDSKKQEVLYIKSGGRKDAKGNWVGGNGKVARPGSSWHEYGMAIDVSSKWLKDLEKDAKTSEQKLLTKFGLYKPLTKGNKTTVFEDWHIQAFECVDIPVNRRSTLKPTKV